MSKNDHNKRVGKGQFYIIAAVAIATILIPILITSYNIGYTKIEDSPQRVRTNINKVLAGLDLRKIVGEPEIAIGNRDIVLAIDTSGSMLGQRLEDAKQASKTLMDCAEESDRLYLMRFCCWEWCPWGSPCWPGQCLVYEYPPFLHLTPANKTTLGATIDGFSANGFTPIGKTLRTAGDVMNNQADPLKRRMIILMSDGEETCRDDPCDAMDEGIIPGNVSVYTVGFQVNSVGQDQLICVAQKSGGEYYYVSTGEELEHIFCKLVSGFEADISSFMDYIRDSISGRLLNLEFDVDTVLTHTTEIDTFSQINTNIDYTIENFEEYIDNTTFIWEVYENTTLVREGSEILTLDPGETYTKQIILPYKNYTNYTSNTYLNTYFGQEIIKNEVDLDYLSDEIRQAAHNILVNYNVSTDDTLVTDSVIVNAYLIQKDL